MQVNLRLPSGYVWPCCWMEGKLLIFVYSFGRRCCNGFMFDILSPHWSTVTLFCSKRGLYAKGLRKQSVLVGSIAQDFFGIWVALRTFVCSHPHHRNTKMIFLVGWHFDISSCQCATSPPTVLVRWHTPTDCTRSEFVKWQRMPLVDGSSSRSNLGTEVAGFGILGGARLFNLSLAGSVGGKGDEMNHERRLCTGPLSSFAGALSLRKLGVSKAEPKITLFQFLPRNRGNLR